MRTEKVSFYSEGIKLAGVLYLPDGEPGKPYPGIVQGLLDQRSQPGVIFHQQDPIHD